MFIATRFLLKTNQYRRRKRLVRLYKHYVPTALFAEVAQTECSGKTIAISQLPSRTAFASNAHSSKANVSARRNAGMAASHRTMLAPPRFRNNS
jgi:hypothetical protein